MKEEREIRIVISGKRIILAGILAGALFFAAVAGTLVLVDVVRTDTVSAESYDAAALPTIPAKAWLFAEGYTGEGFEEYILLYNPPVDCGGSGEKVRAYIYFSNSQGPIETCTRVLDPGTRVTVNVNNELMSSFGYSGDVSATVIGTAMSNSTIQKPIVAERAMYFNYQGVWTGGSQTLGYPLQ